MSNKLVQGIDKLGLEMSDSLIDDLERYLKLLDKWNRAYNLTSINDPEERVIKHLLDSLSVAPHLLDGNLLDVGTGAGLPGLIIALLERDRAVTLVDSNQKKTRFLNQAGIELKLENITVIHGRIEQIKTDAPFSNIVSRAFSSLKQFIESTDSLLTPQGQWLAMKGTIPAAEIDEIGAMEIEQDIVCLSVPFLQAERHLVRMKMRKNQ